LRNLGQSKEIGRTYRSQSALKNRKRPGSNYKDGIVR